MITVGYGDYAPKTEDEMILCIFTMLCTCGVFAYALNSINGIIYKTNSIIHNLRRQFTMESHNLIERNHEN